MLMRSFFISTSVLDPLNLRDEDPLLNINKLSFADLTEIFHIPLVINPI